MTSFATVPANDQPPALFAIQQGVEIPGSDSFTTTSQGGVTTGGDNGAVQVTVRIER